VTRAAPWNSGGGRPQPLFAHTLAGGGVVLHARAPLPAQARPLLDEVDRVGRRGYYRLAPFQTEGYADYLAFDHRVDLAAGRAALLRDDPKRSGLYRRYELLVAYLLDRKHLDVESVLAIRNRDVEQALLTDPDL
jgi:hypothetical protein